MKLLLLACIVVTVSAAAVEKCAWGESYWCSSLKTAHMCGATQHCIDTVWAHDQLKQDNATVCEFCESIIKDVRALIDDKANQKKVRDFLESACKMIPVESLSQLCDTTMNSDFDAVLQLIDSELDPARVCAVIGLCSGFPDLVQHSPVKAPLATLKNQPICAECTKWMVQLKAMISSKTTQKEIEDLIEKNLCVDMGQYEAMCKLAIETYGAEIFQMLLSEMDPAEICSAIGLCSSSSSAHTLLAKFRLRKSPLFGAVKAGSAEECLMCKTVLGELQNLDRDTKTQKEVEDFIKQNLCSHLGSLAATCEATVDQYGPELFELLANELDPDVICQALGLCNQANPVRTATPPKSAAPKVSDPSTTCVLCEFIIKTIDSELEDNATAEEIIAVLDKVCESLPDTLKATCELFVNEYGATVIALLLKDLDPQQVCTELKLCASKLAIHKQKSGSPSTQCVLCQFIMTQLDQLLEKNQTKTQILAALDKVCAMLPVSLRTECTDFVNTYGPAVIILLEQELDPQVVCASLGLCSASKKLDKKALSQVSDDEMCGVCETVIQYVDSLLQDKATVKEIEQALKKVCNYLPDNVKQQCETMVDTYGAVIIQLIAQEMNPREICTAIGLCSGGGALKESNLVDLVPATKVNLVGGNKCTYGPAFWCVNMENAVKCSAVNHCKKYVWNK